MKLRTRDKVFIFIVLSIIIFDIFFCVISLGYFFITRRTADIKKIDLEYVLESFKIFWFYVVAGLATGLIDFYLIVWMINYHNSKPTKIIDKEERATSTMYGSADFMTDEEKLENFGCDLSEEVEKVKVKFGEINNQGTANNINKDEDETNNEAEKKSLEIKNKKLKKMQKKKTSKVARKEQKLINKKMKKLRRDLNLETNHGGKK